MVKKGKDYEIAVKEIFSELEDSNTSVDFGTLATGDGKTRQIDVLIEGPSLLYPDGVNNSESTVILECKDYKGKVGIGKVDELIGKLQDVQKNRGVLVSNSGFTQGAFKRANRDGRIILASVINSENPHVRARIKIPVAVVVKIIKPYLVTNADNKVYPTEKKALDIIDDILKTRINKQTLLSEKSFYSLTTNWTSSSDEVFHFEWIYKVGTKTYIKNLELDENFGVYDFTNEVYVTKNFSFKWTYGDLEKNWTVIDENAIPEKTNIFDMRIVVKSKTIIKKRPQ